MTTAARTYRDLMAFIRLGRPHFLPAGFVMQSLGVCAALYAGAALDWRALLLGQVAITATQWMVHYANDYFDLHADSLNKAATVWSGGSQVLTGGELHPRVAYRAAVVLALIAVGAAASLVLFARSGPVAPLLIGLTLFLAWGYSAPPFRWLSRGIGEFVTALIVAVLTPALGFYLQAGYIPAWFLLVVWAPFCLQLCFQIAVAFPDAESDAAAGKRTLVVRDKKTAHRLYLASLTAAYLAPPLMLLAGLPLVVAVATALPVPLAAWLWRRAARGGVANPGVWATSEWGNVILVMLTALAEAAAFAWASI